MLSPIRSPSLPAPASKPVRARRSGESSLLDGITIDYGPPELLGRLFLKAEAHARLAGVRLEFAPMERLREANKTNGGSWRRLVPVFDTTVNDLSTEDSFCIIGYNANNEIVATQAARLYRWTNTTFKQEAESLRMFYRNPELSKGPDESCTVTARSAENILGRVAYSGAVWHRPDYRGKGLISCVTRISKALAFTRWYTDVTMSLMIEDVVAKGTAERTGYSNVEFEVMLNNSPLGTHRTALIWMREQELLDHLEKYLARSDPQIDRVIYDGAA